METVRKLTNEELGMLWRKHQEMILRIEKGQIDFKDSADALQQIIIEGNSDNHLKVIRGELCITKPEKSDRLWREENGIIYFTVVSDGATGSQWIYRLEKKGSPVNNVAKELLQSPNFNPTNGVTYQIAVLKASLWDRDNYLFDKVLATANERGFAWPHAEVGPLICDTFTSRDLKEMGCSQIDIMQESVRDCDRGPFIVHRRNDESPFFDAHYGKSFGRFWGSCQSFAFLVVTS